MYNDILRYRRSLKKQLRCGPLARKKLLDRFGGSLAPFLEENPAPGYEQLVSAFGPPGRNGRRSDGVCFRQRAGPLPNRQKADSNSGGSRGSTVSCFRAVCIL